MIKDIFIYLFLLSSFFGLVGCSLDRHSETERMDKDYWRTKSDFEYAANQLYVWLDQNFVDLRADDLTQNNYPDDISAGTRKVPAESADWTKPFLTISAANRIIERAPEGAVYDGVKRYIAEAHFFRAYTYHMLVRKYGDMPWIDRSINNIRDTLLYTPRISRLEVVQKIYEDLEFAISILPQAGKINAAEYGRVSKSAAMALLARIALYEGTHLKFHEGSGYEEHLRLAYQTANSLILTNEHELYGVGVPNVYKRLFEYDGEGPTNRENIFVKVFGNREQKQVTHNLTYQLCVHTGLTRNFMNLYLQSNGLPYIDDPESEYTYNFYFQNRDPRLEQTALKRGEKNYTLGPFVPYQQSRTGFGIRKFVITDQGDQPSTLDFPLIRYAEVLLIYAEAKFEHDDMILNEDLDISVNAIRRRVGFNVPLTNEFIITNGLDMREEIRRERSVELAVEGHRYDDLIRWKTAEKLLPTSLYGAKFIAGEWGSASTGTMTDKLTAKNILIVESEGSRFFNPLRDYLYPIPSSDLAASKGKIIQNPNWN